MYFPFHYKGHTYSTCINSIGFEKQNVTWCPIAVDENNEFRDEDRHWEYCTPVCNKKISTGTTLWVTFIFVVNVIAFIILLTWHRNRCKIRRNAKTGQFEFSRMQILKQINLSKMFIMFFSENLSNHEMNWKSCFIDLRHKIICLE